MEAITSEPLKCKTEGGLFPPSKPPAGERGVLQPPRDVTGLSAHRVLINGDHYRGASIVGRSRLPSIASVLLLATGCHNPSAPVVVPSSYVARTIEGRSLPVTLQHGGATDVALLADTLHLYPLGVAERISLYRLTRFGGAVTVDTIRAQESYTIRGDSLRFDRDCPPEACVSPPGGIFSSDRRQLLLRLWPFGPTARYDRVSP
jgi:hypothetical protein